MTSGDTGTHVPGPSAEAESRVSEDALRLLTSQVALYPGNVRLWLGTVERLLGRPIPVPADRSGQDVHALVVDACTRQPFGLSVLSEAMPELGVGPGEVDRMKSLADEWQAIRFHPDADWTALRSALRPLLVPRLTVLCRSATQGRLTSLPERCTTPWDALVFLTGLNAPPSGLPSALLFLARLADEVRTLGGPDAACADRIRAWAEEWADDWSLREELTEELGAARRADERPGGPHPPESGSLVIQLSPDGLEPDRYDLAHWLQTDPLVWQPVRGEDRTVLLRDVHHAVGEIVRDAERETGGGGRRLRLEFVLPFELLNLPVDEWSFDAPYGQEPLSVRYPVVVRSLDRLRNRGWHRDWRRRWDRLAGGADGRGGGGGVHWSPPGGVEGPGGPGVPHGSGHRAQDGAVHLFSRLRGDPGLVALVLSAPPGKSHAAGRAEMMTALAAGVPIVVWHREDCSDEGFRASVDALVHGSRFQDLPLRLAEFKRRSFLAGPGDPLGYGVRHLTLLWDDPEHQPEAAYSQQGHEWGEP